MKCKTIEVESLAKVLLFCPNCHRSISLPFKGGNVNIQSSLTLLCGNCKNGKVKVSVKKQIEDLESGEE